MDENIKNLLQKYNIPSELMKILAYDAIRMSLDESDVFKKGITFYSKDNGKLFAITRCIEKIRREKTQYANVLDVPGIIIYAGDKQEALKERKPEQVIDLDNLDMAEERKKSVFRYANSFVENKDTISDLGVQIDKLSGCYSQLNQANISVNLLNEKIHNYKSKLTEIENSIIPNFFRHKKIKMYNKKIANYMKQLDVAGKLHEVASDACDKADTLIKPRKKRIQRLSGFNSIMCKRITELVQKYEIPQDTINKHVSESIGISEVPVELIVLHKVRKYEEDVIYN